MTDQDLDQLLTRHGQTWRVTNADRPTVDWTQLPSPKPHRSRRWVVATTVVAAAAVVAVAVAVLPSSGNGNVIGHPGIAPASALRGAPKSYVALKGKRVYVAQSNQASGSAPLPQRITALAASNGRSGYFAVNRSNCRATIYRLAPSNPYGDLRYHAVATVSGQISRNSMAVSPDGTKLAYALVRRPAADGPRRGQCLFANALVVVALATQTRHVFTGSFPVAIQDLVWAPDSRHLFYSGAPSAIGTGDYDTHELDTAESTHDLVSADARPYLTRTAGTSYGPVFSWHGQPVTIIDGTMRELNGHGGVGEALATQFPTGTIESVSSDPTGNHLLISVNAGPQKIYHETAAGTTITTRTEYLTYRWDNGYLTNLTQSGSAPYRQPGW